MYSCNGGRIFRWTLKKIMFYEIIFGIYEIIFNIYEIFLIAQDIFLIIYEIFQAILRELSFIELYTRYS